MAFENPASYKNAKKWGKWMKIAPVQNAIQTHWKEPKSNYLEYLLSLN